MQCGSWFCCSCSVCGPQVKAIQDEYQSYMERVRGVAQGAIDAANNGFQAARHAVTGRLDAAVHQLQARFFSAPVRSGCTRSWARLASCSAWPQDPGMPTHKSESSPP